MPKGGEVVSYNPYVEQMGKYAGSLEQLSKGFKGKSREEKRLTRQELNRIYKRVTAQICFVCPRQKQCLAHGGEEVRGLLYNVMEVAEQQGNTFSGSWKRAVGKYCMHTAALLQETLEEFGRAKKQMAWELRLAEDRENYRVQMQLLAGAFKQGAKELRDRILSDVLLEKKIGQTLKKKGIRMSNLVLYVVKSGHYRIYLTARVTQGQCAGVKEVAQILSDCVGRSMNPLTGQRQVFTREYDTLVFAERPPYYVLHGSVRAGKEKEKGSGDNFLVTTLAGYKQVAVISDGMGSGEKAGDGSEQTLEWVETFLTADFPERIALEMANIGMIAVTEEVRFATVDLGVVDLYQGVGEFYKAGAAATYVKRGRRVERFRQSSLPLGVTRGLRLESCRCRLKHGDQIVMVTDGVADALPFADTELALGELIGELKTENPKELANQLLNRVLAFRREPPRDDMLILVMGIWKET